MADVSSRPPVSGDGDSDGGGGDGHPRRGWSGRSRGQLLLVTALALAVLLVSLALLLNTAIYTENLATRGADPGSADALSHQRDAVQGVGRAMAFVNDHHAETNETLYANLTASVLAWDNATARHAAVDADAAGASLASTTNGTQAVQNRTRNFTAANGTANWTLAEGVAPNRGLRAFRLSVRPDKLESVPSPASPAVSDLSSTFYVDVTDADPTWRVHVYDNDSEVQVAAHNVTAGNVTTDANCSAAPTNGTVAVDLTAGTVGGRECEALTVFSDVDESYDVSYANGDAIDGTYSVVLNQSSPGPNAGPYNDRSSGDVPYVAPAVYAAELTVVFESQRVTYETTVRVAPGETDD